MSRVIGVVAAQVASVPLDPEATWAKFEREVRVLANSLPAFDLFVFPELYLSGLGTWDTDYPPQYDLSVAQTIPGPLTDRLCALARDVKKWIVPGSIFEKVDDHVHNTALAISPAGEIVATYRKLFPWMPLETSQPGDGFTVFDIPDIGRFGLMICYDGWFPEVSRALAWLGAEAILQPTATRTIDRRQELILAQANAISNQVYVINPNMGGMFGTGSSIVVDPEGTVMAQGGAGEEFLTQIIDLDRVSQVREFGTAGLNRMWQQLRDAPPPGFPQYHYGFAAGEVMHGLGPLHENRPVGDRRRSRLDAMHGNGQNGSTRDGTASAASGASNGVTDGAGDGVAGDAATGVAAGPAAGVAAGPAAGVAAGPDAADPHVVAPAKDHSR